MHTTTPLLAALPVLHERFCAEIQLLNGEALDSLDSSALERLLESMLPDGSWADIEYSPGDLRAWAATQHLVRLISLSMAWSRADTPLHGQAGVLAAVLRGLECWYAKALVSPNWWWNYIGAPTLLGNVLLPLKGACERSYIDRAAPVFTAHQPALQFTGQNLVWVAAVEIRHGLLTDDPDLITQGFTLIGREIRLVPSGEGIQPDMSFFQHGRLLYSGGYGQGFAADVAFFIWLSDGTPYALPRATVDLFTRYLLDGSRWLVRGRTFDYGAIGREITRVGHDAARFYQGAGFLARIDHPRHAELRTLAAAYADPAGRSFVSGNRYFWCADLMTHHRADYALTVRMTSNRLLNADRPWCGGEGRLCHHMAEGATFMYRDGDEYRDLFPVWNWRQIPGTTVEQQEGPFDPDGLCGVGERDFAGGASDGTVGCAGMDFSRRTLTAKKSWFLFDEGLLALGAGISAQAEAPVRTTLNQCRRRGPVWLQGTGTPLPPGAYALADGAAFWHDGMAYHLLAGQGTLQVTTQAGAWNDCGVGSAQREEQPVLNAGLDHGVKPTNAGYAYLVLPAATPEQAFTQDPARFVIVRNDAQLQAVWQAQARRGQAVFYAPGALTFPDGQHIAVDRPCVLLYRPDDAQAQFTLADPRQREDALTLSLSGLLCATVGVSLPQQEYAGSSITLTVGRPVSG
ncbi:MAG TPA: polysaccharide lyase family 8 super-sandwich domain-containing protein [Armatimonadota bacterium]|jgi:chondroitin AC lyase